MPPVRVSFIGFGEVASVFSEAIRESGADVLAYDVNLDRPQGRAMLQQRVRAPGIQFCPLPQAVRNADYLLSTVTPERAREAAQACAAHLQAGQIYVDLNTTSPAVKIEVGRIVREAGADFVEGAILGAVGATGAATRILTAGERGQCAAETLSRLGLHVTYYSPEIGKAALFKMLRSIFSKGLEALLLELMIAGKRAGIEKELWQDLVVDLMSRAPFEQVAANWVQTHPLACARRHHELGQVAATMRELGVEPVMTSGTEAFFQRSGALGFEAAFPERPRSVADVVNFMEERLGENGGGSGLGSGRGQG